MSKMPMQKSITVKGGISEFADIDLVLNHEVSETYFGRLEDKPCEHWIFVKEKQFKNFDGTVTRTERIGFVPRVVIAQNEGGSDFTSVCLDCLLERVEENKEFLGL